MAYSADGLKHYIKKEFTEAVIAWNKAIEMRPSDRMDLDPWIKKAKENPSK